MGARTQEESFLEYTRTLPKARAARVRKALRENPAFREEAIECAASMWRENPAFREEAIEAGRLAAMDLGERASETPDADMLDALAERLERRALEAEGARPAPRETL